MRKKDLIAISMLSLVVTSSLSILVSAAINATQKQAVVSWVLSMGIVSICILVNYLTIRNYLR
jgi:hypothetical protein